MDNPETVTHVSLCAGYGGIDLGLRRTGLDVRTVAYVEIEAFACANLVAKMEAQQLDAAPIWTDLKTFDFGAFRDRVDILSGGYPCQPFSAAGKRLGKDDPRHLWPWIADGIDAMRPRWCFFENVEGHISKGLRDVLSDLEGRGFKATWGIFSASEIGAPHQRRRVFVLAHAGNAHCGKIQPSKGWTEENTTIKESCINGDQRRNVWPSRPGKNQYPWEPPRVVRETQPSLCGNPDGTAGGIHYAELCVSCDNRTDELRLLGNGVVPATAERAWRVLYARLMADSKNK